MRARSLVINFLLVSLTVLSVNIFAQSNNPIFGGGNDDGFDAVSFRQSTSNFIFFGSAGDGFHSGCYTIPTTNQIFNGAINDGFHAGCFRQSETNSIFGGSKGDGFVSNCFTISTNNLVFSGGNGDGFSVDCFRQQGSNSIFGGSNGDGFASLCFMIPANNSIFAGGYGDGFDAGCFTVLSSNPIFAGGYGDGFDATCALSPSCGPGNDGNPPDVLCNDLTIQLNDGGSASITSLQVDAGSSDACGIASYTLDRSLFNCDDLGLNTVQLTVTDNSGNAATCDADITVTDLRDPVAKCIDLTVQIGIDGTVDILAGDIDDGSYDNCAIATMSLSESSFTCADTGVHIVTLSVEDASGNSHQCQSNVTVADMNGNCIPPCDTQQIDLAAGWNIMSSYIIADNPDMLDVIQDVAADIIIIKDNAGTVALPSLSLNLIGDWDVTQGYKVKTLNAVSFTMGCSRVSPESTPITLNTGWNMISYLRTDGMDAAAALSSIASNVVIVKSESGNIYIPALNLNLIGDLLPGEGYQVKMTSGASLTYPANTVRYSGSTYRTPWVSVHYSQDMNTGNNATIIVPDGVIEGLEPGDEIGVFNSRGLLVGSTVYQGGHMAFAVWGTDGTIENDMEHLEEGELYQFKAWRPLTDEEVSMSIDFVEGESYFTSNGISVIGIGRVEFTPSYEESSLHIYPNPANDILNFELYLGESTHAVLNLFDISGKQMILPISEEFGKGRSIIQVDVSMLPAGEYFYRIETRSELFNGGFIKIR